jgi:glucose-6-phosphate 1-dehydrogenase
MTTTFGREKQPADVFVAFGITGDLAKVMTFRSLYRLEARGLLECPIVGVAVDDWDVDQLVQRARESIEGTGERLDPQVFDRFAGRLSYVSGDFTDTTTYQRVGAARRDDRQQHTVRPTGRDRGNLAGYAAAAGFTTTGPHLPARILGPVGCTEPARWICPLASTATHSMKGGR